MTDFTNSRVLLPPSNPLRQRHGLRHQSRQYRQDDAVHEQRQSTERNCHEWHREWTRSLEQYLQSKWTTGEFSSCKPNSNTTFEPCPWVRADVWRWLRRWRHGYVYLQLSLRPRQARHGRIGWIHPTSKHRCHGQKECEILMGGGVRMF